ncbi:MAG: alpha/beta hydrolase [Burkholderiaceae bacterium]
MSMTAGIRPVRPDELTRQLREIGAVWQQDIRAAGDRTKALYRPLLAAAPRDGVSVARDLPYGEHPRQVLDVYTPRGARNAPVVAFVHGGAFVRGERGVNDAIYGNVLTWFARHGCVGVNVEYRLAPDAPYPAGAIDVGMACRWMERHIAAHGGDANRLCVIGHSAGGTHVAGQACDPALDAQPRRPDALVLVSARLRADTRPENPNAGGVRAYFGDDPARYDQVSPVTHAARLELPVFVVTAQYENPLLDLYGLEFAHAVGLARGRAPLHTALADHNHISIMAHFNTPEQRLGEEILAFFESSCR